MTDLWFVKTVKLCKTFYTLNLSSCQCSTRNHRSWVQSQCNPPFKGIESRERKNDSLTSSSPNHTSFFVHQSLFFSVLLSDFPQNPSWFCQLLEKWGHPVICDCMLIKKCCWEILQIDILTAGYSYIIFPNVRQCSSPQSLSYVLRKSNKILWNAEILNDRYTVLCVCLSSN